MCGCGFILIVCANKRLIHFFVSHKLCCCVQASVCGGVFLLYFYFFLLLTPYFCVPQIVALREQNAHIQRKVASGEGGEDILEGSEAQQKVHGKVSSLDLNMGGKNGQNYVWIYNNYTTL